MTELINNSDSLISGKHMLWYLYALLAVFILNFISQNLNDDDDDQGGGTMVPVFQRIRN